MNLFKRKYVTGYLRWRLMVCTESVMEWISVGWLVGILQVVVFEIQVTESFLCDVKEGMVFW